MTSFTFMCVAFSLLAVVYSEDDPCVKHKEINDYRRSKAYELKYPERPLCDRDLEAGWYRFTSIAGGQIPEGLVERRRCGTIAPIWLNDVHPTVGGVVKAVNACANYHTEVDTSGCALRVTIGVKYCDPFYVYYLHPPPGCPIAYCAGTRAPCPAGTWSENENIPLPGDTCKPAFPPMTLQPDLSGPEIVGKTFRFTCTAYPPNNFTGQKSLEFVWTFDGEEVPAVPSVEVNDPETKAHLDGQRLQGLLGKSLGCKVRAFFTKNAERRSPWLESKQSYWIGIKPIPHALNLSEADLQKTVKLISTLPVLCENVGGSSCCLKIKLQVASVDKEVWTKNTCVWEICSDDWNTNTKTASVDIPLVASQDAVTRPNHRDLLLTFRKLVADRANDYKAVFNDHRIRSVQIDVADADSKTCTLVTDPHIKTLDGTYYNLFDVGDFTLFRSRGRNFEVQIRTWPCWGAQVTCVCGVAAREDDDLIRIDGCDKTLYSGQIGSPALQIISEELREGTSIKQATDGSQIVIYFPSGAEVSVWGRNNQHTDTQKYLDVTLKIPAIDRNKGAGLCGTFDDNRNNDLMGPDFQTLYTASSLPRDFTNSWSLNNTRANLFRYAPESQYPVYVTRNCLCVDTNNTVICTYEPEKSIVCHGCTNGPKKCNANDFKITCWTKTGLQRPSANDVYFDGDEARAEYDPLDLRDFVPVVPKWPTPSGITEQMAEIRCREGLRNSSLWTLCEASQEDVRGYVANCVEDIKIGDSFEPVISAKSTFTVDCQVKLGKDPSNYITTPEGKSVVKQEIREDVCSVLCDEHGYCDRGVCICDAGWTGDNCQLPKDRPPVLHRIRGSTVCDINERPCRKIFIDAENIQNKDTFDCKVREIAPDGTLSDRFSMQEAEFIAITRMACALPDANIKTVNSIKRFAITATVDGRNYSSPSLNLTVFDSVCWNCTETGCERLPSTCLINNLCFADGDHNPNDGSKMCLVAESTTQWIQVYPNASASLSGPDNEGDLRCTVHTSDTSPRARYNASFYVNGQRVSGEELPPGTLVAKIRRDQLGMASPLQVTCKVRSYYTDRMNVSPYIESNTTEVRLYPSINNVTLSGPEGGAMACTARQTDSSPNSRYKVSWYVDGRIIGRELGVTVGKNRAAFSRAHLPATGVLTCKMSSYYADVNIFSPYVPSNAVDLATV